MESKPIQMNKRLFLIAMISVLGLSLFAQTKPDWRKLHYLSEEEMNTPLEKSRSFTPTDPPEGEIRNVAEFDPMQGVLIRYPFGIPMSLIKAMAEETVVVTIVANSTEQNTVTSQYENAGVNMDNVDFLIAPTNSYWTRDYGPWFVFDGNGNPGIVDFPYNRPRPFDDDIPVEMAEFLDIDLYGMDLISTGGNYMCSGFSIAASTDLVWEENPSLTHEEVAGYVNDYLGNTLYDVLEDPLGEYIKHIDCWSKYLSPGKVLLGQVPEWDPRYQDYEDLATYFESTLSSYGKPWEVIRVFTPGDPPNTPYTNSLILNERVFVPVTGSQWDDEAIAVYEEAMPGYDIVPIQYNGWENTDALHCRTKGIADIGMLYIKHIPILGNVGYHPEYDISAKIVAHSGEDIYADSVLLYYKVNGGDYITTVMTLDSADYYSGTVAGILPSDTVEYYIYAADESGRQEMQPTVGPADPFWFKNVYFPVTELDFNPDSVIFLNDDQMMNGIPLHIINGIEDKSTITSLTEFGNYFPWYVEEMPDLPYELESGDTLTLNILCPFVTSKSGLVIDTMFLETLIESYTEIIAIDRALISGVDLYIGEPVTVFPNPFSDVINIKINSKLIENVRLQLYDLKGNLVAEYADMNTSGVISFDVNKNGSLKNGTYFYRLQYGDSSKSGKLILLSE